MNTESGLFGQRFLGTVMKRLHIRMELLLRRLGILLFMVALTLNAAAQPRTSGASRAAAYDVKWNTLGSSEKDSLPLGNGDIAANVWTEQNGDIVLLVAKADAWTELGKLVKLGRIRIHLDPNPFVPASGFTQALHLEHGDIEIGNAGTAIRIWADANHPALHVEVRTAQPGSLRTTLETWRKAHPVPGSSPDKAGMSELGSDQIPVDFQADTILPAQNDTLAWYHFNEKSFYPITLQQEHLESVLDKHPDPLLHRCFGALLTGPGLISKGDTTLVSASPRKEFRIDLVALTQPRAVSPQAWHSQLVSLLPEANPSDLKNAWAAHQKWWEDFWDRSWVQVTGTEEARQVSQGYAIQRYMMASSSRGELPVKFNGGLFTVGHDMADDARSNAVDHNPDYRGWGNAYWNQNNRLLYWPLLQTGDYDLLKPWFGMYLSALPLATDRTRLYYHHAGAAFPETMYFWGLPSIHDFGWNNPGTEIQSRWQRYHVQGALEVIAQMLDYFDYTQDRGFAEKSLVPFADAIVTYYDQHWPRAANGKIHMAPAQSLETYQLDAVNPTPDIAGLKSVLPRLLALPDSLATTKQRAAWAKTLRDTPDLPLGRTDARGKTPPLGLGDPKGIQILLPAEKYGKTSNSENPELYVAFPYRLHGVGKPNLKLAQDTFAARRSPQNTCWGQDGTQAAVLGLTSVAQKAVVSEFTNYGDQRFSWFWKPAHDWIPDMDNGGSGMITLQSMLLQADGRKLYLLPAWPAEWSADFKLRAPQNTVVQGHVEKGRLVRLQVTPTVRRRDLVIVKAESK